MQVVLQNIAEPEAVEVPEPPEPADTVEPAPLDDAAPEPAAPPEAPPAAPEPAAAPAPKKRGRPPKARVEAPPQAPKARPAPKPKTRKPKPPVEESSDSSDVDDTLRNVYNHVAKPNMETAILQFLVNRKQAESTAAASCGVGWRKCKGVVHRLIAFSRFSPVL